MRALPTEWGECAFTRTSLSFDTNAAGAFVLSPFLMCWLLCVIRAGV